MTKENIKSMFNIKRAWCEESHTLTKESIEILYPTVRDNNSHLYFTFNRNDEDDPVYVFYKTFNCKGEKLKTKIDGKYYSPHTGIEYKVGKIGESINENVIKNRNKGKYVLCPFYHMAYNPKMLGYTSVFVNKTSAFNLFHAFKIYDPKAVIVKLIMKISEDLHTGNAYPDEVMIGKSIDEITEYD
jgi:hypothetical protein